MHKLNGYSTTKKTRNQKAAEAISIDATPWRTGTVLSVLPKHFTTIMRANGSPIDRPKRTLIDIGTMLNV